MLTHSAPPCIRSPPRDQPRPCPPPPPGAYQMRAYNYGNPRPARICVLGKVCGFKLADQISVVGALYRADVCIWAVCTPRRPIHPRIHCQCDQTRPWLFFAARLIDSIVIAPKSSAGIPARLHARAVIGPRGCWETSGARYLGQYTPPDSVFEDVRPALPDITFCAACRVRARAYDMAE